MLLEYWNISNPYYSETKRSYTTAQDWSYTGAGVTALEIKFFGDVNSVLDPPMYVKLSDDTNTVQVNHDDGNDVTEQWQHTWVIPLNDFSGVALSNITGIALGIGDGKIEGGAPSENGTLYFDDIRLYPPRCFPEYGPAADFTDDCRVDVNDLFFMARDWGKSGGWYEASMPAYTPVVEYLFEEGSGTLVANTGSLGSSHDLVIGRGVDKSHNWVTDPNNDPCWVSDTDPCRGWTLWFDGRDGSYDNPDDNDPLTGGGGDYLLGPALNLNSNTVTLATWIKPDPWLMDWKKGIYEQSGLSGFIRTRDESSAAGFGYMIMGDYIYYFGLGYEWNGKAATWQFHSNILIPDWQWSLAALVIEPDAGILYLADTNDTADPNDDVLHSAIHVYTQQPEEWDGLFGIACDGGIVDGGWIDSFFRGQMDGVRIYDVSLTTNEIMSLAEMDEIIYYYPLDSVADLCVGRKDPCDPLYTGKRPDRPV